jgi:hypothetical protein
VRPQVCARAQSDRPSLWAATVAGSIAVVHIDSAPDTGASVMTATAEVNRDRAVHAATVTRLAEVFVAAGGSSVLVSGGADGTIGVRRRGGAALCDTVLHRAQVAGRQRASVCVDQRGSPIRRLADACGRARGRSVLWVACYARQAAHAMALARMGEVAHD